ncbi:hypothetical protein C8R43DRAFT_955111 [Mycena crocata]|nr:hypothetical protein C8R43DRAFT_955111 [Mycena crocata]
MPVSPACTHAIAARRRAIDIPDDFELWLKYQATVVDNPPPRSIAGWSNEGTAWTYGDLVTAWNYNCAPWRWAAGFWTGPGWGPDKLCQEDSWDGAIVPKTPGKARRQKQCRRQRRREIEESQARFHAAVQELEESQREFEETRNYQSNYQLSSSSSSDACSGSDQYCLAFGRRLWHVGRDAQSVRDSWTLVTVYVCGYSKDTSPLPIPLLSREIFEALGFSPGRTQARHPLSCSAPTLLEMPVQYISPSIRLKNKAPTCDGTCGSSAPYWACKNQFWGSVDNSTLEYQNNTHFFWDKFQRYCMNTPLRVILPTRASGICQMRSSNLKSSQTGGGGGRLGNSPAPGNIGDYICQMSKRDSLLEEVIAGEWDDSGWRQEDGAHHQKLVEGTSDFDLVLLHLYNLGLQSQNFRRVGGVHNRGIRHTKCNLQSMAVKWERGGDIMYRSDEEWNKVNTSKGGGIPNIRVSASASPMDFKATKGSSKDNPWILNEMGQLVLSASLSVPGAGNKHTRSAEGGARTAAPSRRGSSPVARNETGRCYISISETGMGSARLTTSTSVTRTTSTSISSSTCSTLTSSNTTRGRPFKKTLKRPKVHDVNRTPPRGWEFRPPIPVAPSAGVTRVVKRFPRKCADRAVPLMLGGVQRERSGRK